MTTTRHLCIATLLLAAASATSAARAADAAAGGDVFDTECSDCHSVTAGKNKKGPSLAGVVGRKAASISDFNYSDAMRQSNITWTTDKLEAYIKAPKQVVPGGKMKYEGDEVSAKDIQDVVAFLATKR